MKRPSDKKDENKIKKEVTEGSIDDANGGYIKKR